MDYDAAKRESDSSPTWKGRPALARVIRLFLWLMPIAASLLFGLWASHAFPPLRLGINRWLWWIGLSILATVVLRVVEQLSRRLAPIAMLLRLSLIFPDQAPNRFSIALRSGNTAKVKKRIDAIQHGGAALSGDDSVAAQMLDLIALLSEHDRMTRGHAERVRGYTDLIAEELSLDPIDAGKLRWAALLHDMGKLEVPAEILNKAGKPTAEEWAILQRHPAAANKHLEPIAEWLGDWRHAADGHHERWDGNGYPQGLAGKEIPRAARIVAVADAYDVMTSARSYKKPLPPEVARQEIAKNAGTQFDPTITRAFLNIGLGDLRQATGPLAWLGGLPGIRNLPLGNAVTPVAANVVTTVGTTAAAIGAAVAGAIGVDSPPADPPPPAVAFAEPAAPEVLDISPMNGPENAAISGGLRATGNGELTIAVVVNPENGLVTVGQLTVGDDGTEFSFDYSPNADFVGDDSFTVEICNSADTCVTEVVPVKVSATNKAPVADDYSARVEEGGSIEFTISSTSPSELQGGSRTDLPAQDPDGDQLEALVGDKPLNGEAYTTGDTVVFTHDGSETIEASFFYKVSDGELLSEAGLVTLEVVPTNDEPEAADDKIDVVRGSERAFDSDVFTDNDSDIDGDQLTVLSASGASAGTVAVSGGSLTYGHDGSQSTSDQFEYTVSDGAGGTATALVSVTIVDPPATTTTSIAPTTTTAPTTTLPNQPPNSATFAKTVVEGQSLTVDVASFHTDPEGDALTVSSILTAGSHAASTTYAGSSITYVHDGSEESADTIEYKVADSAGNTASGTINITISAVNDKPVVLEQAFVFDEDVSAGPTGQFVVVTDPDNTTHSFDYSNPVGGGWSIDSATGEIIVTDVTAVDYETLPLFTIDVDVSDGVDTVRQTITITVGDVNEAPLAPAGGLVSVGENEPAGTVVAAAATSDPDGDPLTYSITDGDPDNDFAIDGAGEITTTTPLDREAQGSYVLTVIVSDPAGLTATADVAVSVIDQNEPPSAGSSAATLAEGDVLVFDVSGAHIDPEGDPFTITSIVAPGASSAGTSFLGTVLQYSHDGTEGPNDLITYKVTDSAGNPAIGTIAVTLTPVNDPPVVAPQAFSFAENVANGPTGQFIAVTDPDNATHSFEMLAPNPTDIWTVDAATGEIIIINAATIDFETSPSNPADVKVSDDTDTTIETMTVAVTDVNEAPVFNTGFTIGVSEDASNGTAATSGTIAVDPEGPSGLLYSIATDDPTDPGHFIISPTTGQITTTGGPFDFETKSSYTLELNVTDGSLSDTETVTIPIVDVDEAPVTSAAAFSVDETAASGYIVGTINWTDVDSSTHTIDITPATNPDLDGDGQRPFVAFPSSSTGSQLIRVLDADDLDFGVNGQITNLEVIISDATNSVALNVEITTQSRFALSPHMGSLIINEVLWSSNHDHPTDPHIDGFIELKNVSATAVNLRDWIVSDVEATGGVTESNMLPTAPIATDTVLQPGQSVALWEGSSSDWVVGTEAAINLYANLTSPALTNSDDVWVFDDNGEIVAYLAWGTEGSGSDEIGDRPPITAFGMWDTTHEPSLGAALIRGQSIALTPDGSANAVTNSACWEPTTSGDADGRCAHSPLPTFSNDAFANRTASPGANNNQPEFVSHLLISEYSSNGAALAGDFIELYNPANFSIDLDDYELRLDDGVSTLDTDLPDVDLLPGQHFLIAPLGSSLPADLIVDTWGNPFPERFGIALSRLPSGPGPGFDVDKVGTGRIYTGVTLGTTLIDPAISLESFGLMPTTATPLTDVSNERKSLGGGNCTDTNSNAADFIRNVAIGSPNPQNMASPREFCSLVVTGVPNPASSIVISEFRPAGQDNPFDDAVTLFNPTPSAIDISGYQVKNQGPSDPTPELLHTIPGGTTLEPGQSFLLLSNLADNSSPADLVWSFKDLPDGQSGGVALWIENSSGTILDEVLVDNSAGGPMGQLPPSPYYFLRSWIRSHDGCQDSGNHLADFEFHFVPTDRNSSSPFEPCS